MINFSKLKSVFRFIKKNFVTFGSNISFREITLKTLKTLKNITQPKVQFRNFWFKYLVISKDLKYF